MQGSIYDVSRELIKLHIGRALQPLTDTNGSNKKGQLTFTCLLAWQPSPYNQSHREIVT